MSPDDRRMLDRAEARMREAAGWTDGPRSPLTYQIAEMLQAIGWTSPCDAQWTHLESALPLLRDALYAKARSTREGKRMEEVSSADAPAWFDADGAYAWACGFNDALARLAAPTSPAAQQEPRPETRNEWLHGEDNWWSAPAPDRPVEREPLRFPCGCVSRLTPCEKHDRVLTSYDEPPEVTAVQAIEREGCAADEMEHRDNYMAPNPPPLDTAPAPSSGERERLMVESLRRAVAEDVGQVRLGMAAVKIILDALEAALATPTPSPDAREVLRELEWLESWPNGLCCRICRARRTDGHRPGCRLAAALNGGAGDG